jgi:hypothetical protein
VSAAPSTRVPGWATAGQAVAARGRRLAARHPGLSGLLLFGFITAVCRPASYRTPIGRDGGAYLYMGDVILHGGTPYLDAANNKGPTTFLLFAAIRFVSGTSVVAVRLTLLCFAALAALALAGYVGRLAGRNVGLLAGIAFALLSATAPFPGDDPNSEQYGIAPMVGSWYFATLGGWCSAAAAGALAGAASAMNPAFAVVVPFAAWELWRARGPSPRGIRFGAAVAGAIAVLGPLALWLGLAGALPDFWIQVGGQISGATHNSIQYQRLLGGGGVSNAPWYVVPAPGLWALGVVGCAVALRDPRLRRVAIPALLWIVVGLLRVKLATYEYPHHYYPALAGIVAGIAVGIAALWQAGTARRVALAALVLAAPVWGFVLQPQLDALRTPSYLRSSLGFQWGIAYPLAQYVDRHTRPDEGLYVVGSRGEIYWLADRRAPTRFFDDFPVQAHPQYGPEQIRDLLRHPPAAVVMAPGDSGDPAGEALLKTGRYALRFQPLGPQAGGGVFLLRDRP